MRTNRARGWALGLGLSLAAACHAETTPAEGSMAGVAEPSAGADRVGARGAVVALFDALERGDCDALQGILGGPLQAKLSAQPCAEFLAREPLRTASVQSIGRATVDGRDPRAFHVTVSLGEAGHAQPVLVRVEHQSDGHRVVSM